ncbi:hypothetical protein [Paenibacillus polymyxa]|uniref:hypothetical protein n=1 Tax=Paenibacillus polymyxa TaxID=1406 RepID=UPI0001E6D04C|nr:hypothetical protein [Paenibacillus polymyxa]WPQ59546.1 hypothetical protein SKN87_28190 [Paenibacillus polymyxa]
MNEKGKFNDMNDERSEFLMGLIINFHHYYDHYFDLHGEVFRRMTHTGITSHRGEHKLLLPYKAALAEYPVNRIHDVYSVFYI